MGDEDDSDEGSTLKEAEEEEFFDPDDWYSEVWDDEGSSHEDEASSSSRLEISIPTSTRRSVSLVCSSEERELRVSIPRRRKGNPLTIAVERDDGLEVVLPPTPQQPVEVENVPQEPCKDRALVHTIATQLEEVEGKVLALIPRAAASSPLIRSEAVILEDDTDLDEKSQQQDFIEGFSSGGDASDAKGVTSAAKGKGDVVKSADVQQQAFSQQDTPTPGPDQIGHAEEKIRTAIERHYVENLAISQEEASTPTPDQVQDEDPRVEEPQAASLEADALEEIEEDGQDNEEEMIPPPSPLKRSLRFAEPPDDSVDEEEVEAPKRRLRFADIVEAPPKRAVRFADDEARPKRLLRFADESVPKQSLRFADDLKTKSKKSVRFRGKDLGASKSVRFVDEGHAKRFSLDAPVVARKNVRFLLPFIDAAGKERMRVLFPGIRRVRRKTIKRSTVDVYPDPPLSLVFHFMDAERFSHITGVGRVKTCHALAWVMGIVSAIMSVVCLVTLIIYLHLRPQVPRLSVELFDVATYLQRLPQDVLRQQQIEDRGRYFSYRAYIWSFFYVDYQNTNSRVDFYNDFVTITLFFKGMVVGTAYKREVFVARKSNRTLYFRTSVRGLLMPLRLGSTLLRESLERRLTFVCEFIVKARMSSVGGLKSRYIWRRIRCYINIAEHTTFRNGHSCQDYNY